jgi:DNA-directed RNA polymerase subunit RPC12/RpoP
MYVCQGCGHSLAGTKPATGKCPTCNPPSHIASTGERMRCSSCGHTYDASGQSPQVECPACGVAGQRLTQRVERAPYTPPRVAELPLRDRELANFSRMHERAAIVAWLRGPCGDVPIEHAADRIEAGEHLKAVT